MMSKNFQLTTSRVMFTDKKGRKHDTSCVVLNTPPLLRVLHEIRSLTGEPKVRFALEDLIDTIYEMNPNV